MTRKMKIPAIVMLSGILLSGCADTDRVLFVTTTQIGIDADSKTQSATIGYERYEGYVGPGYDNGGVPPVIARLESNLSISDPKISQVYATGDAARLASGRTAKWESKPLSGEREIMFFGTGTNFGLKATFSTQAPTFSLGYKRQEFSLIPIGIEKDRPAEAKKAKAGEPPKVPAPKPVDGSEDIYLSVLAAFDLNVDNSSFQKTGAGVSQFFATGDAAEQLATRGDIQGAFTREAKDALKVREIKCVKKRDDASDTIGNWAKKSNGNKRTLQAIIVKEFGPGIINWELINCEGFSDERKLVIKKYEISS